MNTSLKAIFGMDSGPFRDELKKIDRSIDGFTQKLAKLGLSAIGFTVITQTFSGIVQHARELEGELDDNERAAQKFAGALESIKRTMLDIGVSALGTLNRFGEWLGKQAAILYYGREQVELAEQIATEAERNIAAIELARLAEEEKAKVKAEIAKIDQKIAEDLFKQIPLADQRNALERRYLDLIIEATNAGTRSLEGLTKMKAAKEVWLELQKTDATIEKQKATDAEKARVALERMAAEKERTLDAEARKNIEIARLLLKGVENLTKAEKVQLDVLTGRIKQRQVEAEVADLLKRGVENLTDEEKERLSALVGVESVQKATLDSLKDQTDEMRKQLNLAKSIVEITGRGSRELSDRELRRKVENLQSEVAKRQAALFQSGGFYDPMLDLQRRDLGSARAELNLRQDVRRTAAQLGEDRAFQRFNGLSEQRFNEILRGARDTNARLLTGIEQLNRKIDQGITVRDISN